MRTITSISSIRSTDRINIRSVIFCKTLLLKIILAIRTFFSIIIKLNSYLYEVHSINNRTVLIFFKVAIVQKRVVLKM